MLPKKADNGSFDQTDHEDSDKITFALKSPIITQESSDSSEKSSSQDRRQSLPSLPLTEIQSLSLSSNQKKNLQAALLNFIATCPIASDGIINVSHDQFEFELLQELSEETLHDYEDCSFIEKINPKACFLNLSELKKLKKQDIRDKIQDKFQEAFKKILAKVETVNLSSSSFLQDEIVPIITSVPSDIIHPGKIHTSNAQDKFIEFLNLLSSKIQEIKDEREMQEKHSKARKCAAWIEYRMMFANKFLSESLINCNAASLLLSSFVLLRFGCDLPIFLNQSDYLPKFPFKDSEDINISDINEQFATSYLKHFKRDQKFQPIDFPRKLRSDTPEELLSYYRSVILDNMLILLDNSSYSNLELFPSASNGNTLVHGIRKNAAHYKSMLDAIQRVQELDILGKNTPKSFTKSLKKNIEKIIAPIHGDQGIEKSLRQTNTKFPSTPPHLLLDRYNKLHEFIAERVTKYEQYDIIDTLARIDYDVSVRHHFFPDGNARTAQAIILLLCAYFNMAAPEIVEGDPKQRFLSRWSVVSIDLDDDEVPQFWYKYYTTLFELPDNNDKKADEVYQAHRDTVTYKGVTLRRYLSDIQFTVDNHYWKHFPLEPDYKRLFVDHVSNLTEKLDDFTQIPRFYVKLWIDSAIEKGVIKLDEKKAFFKDGWSVLWEDVIEKDATIYKHGMRLTYEMTLLKTATGYDMKQLVVFKPERMVFHKFIVYLITHYQIPSEVLLKLKPLFLKLSSIQDFIKKSESLFDNVRKEYEVYLDQCYFDDPLELNRDPILNAFIEKTRATIRGRIATGKCQISPSQSRKIMRMLVVDELLREYFDKKAEDVVEDCFERIQFHPSSKDELAVARLLTPLSRLEFRENDFERVAWIVVGGPAAGKSTLKRDLKIESPVCEINPDDYKRLLYDDGPQNASLVHEESSFIADQIMKALKTMPKRPDVLLDVVKSSDDKMSILAEGGAILCLIIATCEAEDAIVRAYKRAATSNNLEDSGRFVPTKEILLGHKKESLILPTVIKQYRISLDLFDTSKPGEPIRIAQLETKRKELKIYHLSLFLKFIRKALINEYATHKDQVYLNEFDGRAIYKELMKYVDEGVTLNFFNEGILYAKIDPSTGLTCHDGWCERFLEELEKCQCEASNLEELLLYFAYPHYCNGLLIEIPGKQVELLDMELSESMVVRNQSTKNKLRAKESFRELFPKLCGNYPTQKLIEPTPLKERKVPGAEMIDKIRGKDSNAINEVSEEGRAQLLAEALIRLEAKKYDKLMESLMNMKTRQYQDDIQKIIDKALLSVRIFPLAKRLLTLPDSTGFASFVSVWIPDTIRILVTRELTTFKVTNALSNTSLTLQPDDISCAVVGSEESDMFWTFQIMENNDETFQIFVDHDELTYLKLHFKKQNECDRSVIGDKYDETNKDRYQWQLIPIERGNSFLIMNIARKAYLRLNKDRIAEASQGIKNHNNDFAWQLTSPLPETQKESKEESNSSLLKLFLDSSLSDNTTFLAQIAERFPELKLYKTLLDTTPDLVAQLEHRNETLVLDVFGSEWVKTKTSAVIAATNRLLLRLVYLRSLMRNDRTYFPLITPERFNYLCKNLVLPCCQDEESLTFLVLSTILDALGRTTTIQNKIKDIPAEPGHKYEYGHEEYLRSYIKKFDFNDFNKSFSYFQDSKKYEKLYYSNVVTNTFNLGAFVQGESVPYCLYELLKGGEDCQIRLLVLLISFLPIQYNAEFEAEGFTNALYDQFITALTVITDVTRNGEDIGKASIEAYYKYLKLNAQMVGVPVEIPGTTEEEVLTLHRIVALSRSRFPIHWEKIWFVWKKLPKKVKEELIRYMTVTGFDGNTSIYIYYAPAIISNTMSAAKNLEQISTEQVLEYLFDKDAWTIGLYHGLLTLLKIYEKVTIEKLPTLTEQVPYYICYGKQDADEASRMEFPSPDPLTCSF